MTFFLDQKVLLKLEGLPASTRLVIGGVKGKVKHVRSNDGKGTWCGMLRWNFGTLRPVNRSDSDKPLCKMCLRTARADQARAKK